jgi:hypothetical protein
MDALGERRAPDQMSRVLGLIGVVHLKADDLAAPEVEDDQFRLLEPQIPPAKPGGRLRSTDVRHLLDGLFYLVRTGCQ